MHPAVHAVRCRCAAAGLPLLAPTAHLQRYLSAKVHGDGAAYSHALNALLCGLDAHKQQQPDVAVFCRVRRCVLVCRLCMTCACVVTHVLTLVPCAPELWLTYFICATLYGVECE
jgi:hypothetical protein